MLNLCNSTLHIVSCKDAATFFRLNHLTYSTAKMSRSPQAAVRNAVESFTAEKDVKKIVLQSGVVAFFASELATNDLLPSDIDVLLSGVKFLLQNWDTCYAGQPAWPDLCYYITGWLCIAVKIHGNDAALNKSVRNLQFALSKCSKTEQVTY